MRLLSIVALVFVLGACGRRPTPPPEPPSGAPDLGAIAPTPPVAAAPAGSPVELAASCEARTEQPEVAGECTTDADCARAGCSSEVCTAAASAGDVMTTCEVQPCFSVLDTCGCVEGRCRWSIRDTLPEPALPPLAPR